MNDFLRVGVVELRFPPHSPFSVDHVEDYGAPVFVPVYNQCQEPKQMIAAHPVGLLLQHSLMPFVDIVFQGLLPRPRTVYFSFYYQSLELILANEPNLFLLTSPQQP